MRATRKATDWSHEPVIHEQTEAHEGTVGRACAVGDNSSSNPRNCARTSGGDAAFETYFSVPSGVNCAPPWDETNFASLPGSISAFWRNLMLTSSRLRSIAIAPTRIASNFNAAYSKRFRTGAGGSP